MSRQYIYGADGKPAFVVIPFDEYSRGDIAAVERPEASTSEPLLSPDGRFIRLPQGGLNAQIDLVQFIDAWMRRGTISMISVLAIGKRRLAYANFEGAALNGLDAILRRCFLPVASPYQNTMQATTAVVDALVETGVFERSVEPMDGYYRPVQCIRIKEDRAEAFLQKHGKPKQPLPLDRFMYL